MFNSKQKDYGVIKIEGNTVKVFETQSQYANINVGQEVVDARWSGSAIVVYLKDGKVRRYTTLGQYTNS
jgi:hypothetical protein